MEFNLKLNEQEMNIIGIALAQRPFAEVSVLIAKIQQDINKQREEQEHGANH